MPGGSVLLSTLPGTESSLNQVFGRNMVFHEEVFLKNKHAFFDPGGGRFSRAPPFVKRSKKCF
jgi:hypothetical protein